MVFELENLGYATRVHHVLVLVILPEKLQCVYVCMCVSMY